MAGPSTTTSNRRTMRASAAPPIAPRPAAHGANCKHNGKRLNKLDERREKCRQHGWGGMCPVYVRLAALRCIDPRRMGTIAPNFAISLPYLDKLLPRQFPRGRSHQVCPYGAHGTRLHAVTITDGNNFSSRPRLQCSRIANSVIPPASRRASLDGSPRVAGE